MNITPFRFQVEKTGLSTSSSNYNDANILEGTLPRIAISLPNEMKYIKKITAGIFTLVQNTSGATGNASSGNPVWGMEMYFRDSQSVLPAIGAFNVAPHLPGVAGNNSDNIIGGNAISNDVVIPFTTFNASIDFPCLLARNILIPRIGVSINKPSATTEIIFFVDIMIFWE